MVLLHKSLHTFFSSRGINMMGPKKSRILLLSALFSASASARSNGQKAMNSEEADSRVQEDYHNDFGMDQDRENYFQEIYVLQSAPKQIEFGHVCENPDTWEQRYERKDFDQNRHQGKVRWADKKGSHGEHYWDYNHSGQRVYSKNQKLGSDLGNVTPMISEEEGSTHQYKMKKSLPQHGGMELRTVESYVSSRRKPERFLENFRHEIGGIFDLESQNENFFSNQKHAGRQLHYNFPILLDPKNGETIRESEDQKSFPPQPVVKYED